MRNESRRVMATPIGRTVAAVRRPRAVAVSPPGRVLAVAGVVGVLVSAAPAQAAPATSAEAAELVAARGHELEVGHRAVQRGPRDAAPSRRPPRPPRPQLEQAAGRARRRPAAGARHRPRRAWTGEGLGSFQALMTSDSADDFVDRMSTLQIVAGHQNGILGRRPPARTSPPRQAQATAQDAAAAGAGDLRRGRRPAGRPAEADRRVPGGLRPAQRRGAAGRGRRGRAGRAAPAAPTARAGRRQRPGRGQQRRGADRRRHRHGPARQALRLGRRPAPAPSTARA